MDWSRSQKSGSKRKQRPKSQRFEPIGELETLCPRVHDGQAAERPSGQAVERQIAHCNAHRGRERRHIDALELDADAAVSGVAIEFTPNNECNRPVSRKQGLPRRDGTVDQHAQQRKQCRVALQFVDDHPALQTRQRETGTRRVRISRFDGYFAGTASSSDFSVISPGTRFLANQV